LSQHGTTGLIISKQSAGPWVTRAQPDLIRPHPII
jgi:hypothetical protein